MNQVTKRILGLAACSGLLFSCAGPLAFQDPASARRTPGFQGQKRLGSRPMIQQDPNLGPQEAHGLQPQVAQPMGVQQPTQAANPYAATTPQPQPTQAPGASPLLSWSGQVAASSGEGQTRMATGKPKHGLEPQIEGRMHILNLYQEVLDERDSLLIELQRLNTAMRDGEQLLTQLRASEKEYSMRLAALEEVKRTLVEQNRELSARLTVAQIRRLESDKLLLETQIAMHSASQAAPAPESADTLLVSEK